MIVYYLLKVLIEIGYALQSILGRVTTLPLGMDNALSTAVGYFKGIFETIPYFNVVWTCFLWILAFEFTMLILKLILGSRTPTHSTN